MAKGIVPLFNDPLQTVGQRFTAAVFKKRQSP